MAVPALPCSSLLQGAPIRHKPLRAGPRCAHGEGVLQAHKSGQPGQVRGITWAQSEACLRGPNRTRNAEHMKQGWSVCISEYPAAEEQQGSSAEQVLGRREEWGASRKKPKYLLDWCYQQTSCGRPIELLVKSWATTRSEYQGNYSDMVKLSIGTTQVPLHLLYPPWRLLHLHFLLAARVSSGNCRPACLSRAEASSGARTCPAALTPHAKSGFPAASTRLPRRHMHLLEACCGALAITHFCAHTLMIWSAEASPVARLPPLQGNRRRWHPWLPAGPLAWHLQ